MDLLGGHRDRVEYAGLKGTLKTAHSSNVLLIDYFGSNRVLEQNSVNPFYKEPEVIKSNYQVIDIYEQCMKFWSEQNVFFGKTTGL